MILNTVIESQPIDNFDHLNLTLIGSKPFQFFLTTDDQDIKERINYFLFLNFRDEKSNSRNLKQNESLNFFPSYFNPQHKIILRCY